MEKLIDPATRGDPQSPLRWTSKSTSKLADALTKSGHQISPRTVAKLLTELGYSLQSNRKSLKEKTHPDRDAQFQYINQLVDDFSSRRQPVISVDTKKKELIGEYYNQGQEWQRKKEPILVQMHDFPARERGRPLVSREVVVNLIGNTTTKTGLNIQAKLDQNFYPIGQKISDDELERVNLQRDRFQGNWNYSILPNLNLEG